MHTVFKKDSIVMYIVYKTDSKEVMEFSHDYATIFIKYLFKDNRYWCIFISDV